MLGPIPNIIGAFQAVEVLKILTANYANVGKLLVFELAQTFKQNESIYCVQLKRRAGCPSCGELSETYSVEEKEAAFSTQCVRVKKSQLGNRSTRREFLIDVRPSSDSLCCAGADGSSFPRCDLRMDIALIRAHPAACLREILEKATETAANTFYCVCLRGNSSLAAATILNEEEEKKRFQQPKQQNHRFFSLLLE